MHTKKGIYQSISGLHRPIVAKSSKLSTAGCFVVVFQVKETLAFAGWQIESLRSSTYAFTTRYKVTADCIYPFCLHRRVFTPQSMVVVLSGVIVSSLTSPIPQTNNQICSTLIGATHSTLLSLFFSDSYTTSIVLSCRPCLNAWLPRATSLGSTPRKRCSCMHRVQISQHTLGCLLRSSWYTQWFWWRK